MTEFEPTTDMKKPFIVIGHKPIGNYLHAIIKEFQTSHHIYLYYFEDCSQKIADLYQLLQFVGIEEQHRRYPPVEIVSKNNPNNMLKRYEVRWDKIAALKSLKW